MDGEIDIYADLEGDSLEYQFSQLQEENEYLHKHITRLESDVEKFTGEITRLKETQDILTKNISELYNTAKNELQRKDRIINELRAQFNTKGYPLRGVRNRESEDRNNLQNKDICLTSDGKGKTENNVLSGEKNRELSEGRDKNDGKTAKAVDHKVDSDYYHKKNNYKLQDDKFSDTSQRGRSDRNERLPERSSRSFPKRRRSRSREFRDYRHFDESRRYNDHKKRTPDRYEHRREYDRSRYKFERNVANDKKRFNYDEKSDKSVEMSTQVHYKVNSNKQPEKPSEIKDNLNTDAVQQNKTNESKNVSKMDVDEIKPAYMKTPELLKESMFKKSEDELLKIKKEIIKSLNEGNMEQKRKRSKSLSPEKNVDTDVKKLKLEIPESPKVKPEVDEMRKDENCYLSNVVKKLQQRVTPQLLTKDESNMDLCDSVNSKSFLLPTLANPPVEKEIDEQKLEENFNVKKTDIPHLDEDTSGFKSTDVPNLPKTNETEKEAGNSNKLVDKLKTPNSVVKPSQRIRRKVVVGITQLPTDDVRNYTDTNVLNSDENKAIQNSSKNVLYTPQHSSRTRRKTPYKIKKNEETLLTKINTSLLSDERTNTSIESEENQFDLEQNSSVLNPPEHPKDLDNEIQQISNTLSMLDGKTPVRTEARRKEMEADVLEQLKMTPDNSISDLKNCLESPADTFQDEQNRSRSSAESTSGVTSLNSNKTEPPIAATVRRRRRCVVKLKE